MNFNYSDFILVFDTLLNIWWALFIFLTFFLYVKSMKPYKTSFDEEYFKGIPSDLSIIEVSNLVNKKINAKIYYFFLHMQYHL